MHIYFFLTFQLHFIRGREKNQGYFSFTAFPATVCRIFTGIENKYPR
ncbi:hypothetical protein CLOSYM_04030 [[Clostridium] symbiosum ATCC 14940]|uniref:Uncharacterized protein n=1 Tax=[Clostridium] symbiosum ATCC 14940 TaxID=411472 RepID=A0ABC9TST7_CLOSY|nr:hypothetical protein CLOSYM_04030 [[Clostridium] symbiosum ATCC 14940]